MVVVGIFFAFCYWWRMERNCVLITIKPHKRNHAKTQNECFIYMINNVLPVLRTCKSLQVLCKMATVSLLVKIYYCQVFQYLASLFFVSRGKIFSHAMPYVFPCHAPERV